MLNPRDKRAKRFYMKVFAGDIKLYERFLELYDIEVVGGSVSPEDAAFIRFRDEYQEIDDGWIERG